MVFFRGNKRHYSLKVNDMRKKTKKAGVLAAIGMASALIAACGSKNEQFNPDENIASTLYAPEYSDGDNFAPLPRTVSPPKTHHLPPVSPGVLTPLVIPAVPTYPPICVKQSPTATLSPPTILRSPSTVLPQAPKKPPNRSTHEQFRTVVTGQKKAFEVLRPHPTLHSLFFELTVKCNEHCLHCGSMCGDVSEEATLTTDEWKRVIDEVKRDFGTKYPRLCITGGEPLLHRDFFEIMNYAHAAGFSWGMTTNGTLITPEIAHRLEEAGMSTVSVSVDGLKETHEWFRQSPGSYEKTMAGIKNLLNERAFNHVQVTTVVHKRNITELDKLYEIMKGLGIRSWRVINIEPIGRARSNPDLMLEKKDYKYVLDFIKQHRFEDKMEVVYGCSHYLPLDYEREVRPWYFLCNAGVYVASIMYNGNIGACLDIERRPELDYRYCAGDSFHTWNFDKMEPYICLKKML